MFRRHFDIMILRHKISIFPPLQGPEPNRWKLLSGEKISIQQFMKFEDLY